MLEWIIDENGFHIARKDGVEFAMLAIDGSGRLYVVDITDPNNVRRVNDSTFQTAATAKALTDHWAKCPACWRGYEAYEGEHSCKSALEEFKERQAAEQRARSQAESEIVVEPGEGTHYVVEFEGKGFYAKKQPTYEWCFTSKIEEANTYKTIKGARERARHGKAFGYSGIVRIRPISINVTVTA